MEAFDERVDAHSAVELWALLDGVGYCENKNGTLNPMLEAVHTFIQVKTLYKAGLELHRMGMASIDAIAFDRTFYSDETLATMIGKYVPDGVAVVAEADAPEGTSPVAAGKATLFVRS
jgi:hypothetical protein